MFLVLVLESLSEPCCTVLRYDKIRKKSFAWTRKLNDQLNLAPVARKQYEKQETKTNKRPCSLNSVHVQDP